MQTNTSNSNINLIKKYTISLFDVIYFFLNQNLYDIYISNLNFMLLLTYLLHVYISTF